jgi:hypothetical protein
MPKYDPSGHTLLLSAGRALDTVPAGGDLDALDRLADVAELELRLSGTAFVGEEKELARLAVVHWINCHLGRAAEGGRIKSESKGDQSLTYVDAKHDGRDPCALAFALAARLLTPSEPVEVQRSHSVPNVIVW